MNRWIRDGANVGGRLREAGTSSMLSERRALDGEPRAPCDAPTLSQLLVLDVVASLNLSPLLAARVASLPFIALRHTLIPHQHPNPHRHRHQRQHRHQHQRQHQYLARGR